jgi:CRP/FNR family transcriptional regulator
VEAIANRREEDARNMKHADLERLYAHYPALGELPAGLADGVQRNLSHANVPAGSLVFDVGSACEWFLMPVEGAIRVIRRLDDRREMLLYRVLPGDTCILTVSALMGRVAYQATGVVERDLEGYAIPRPLFTMLMAESVAFRLSVFGYFAAHITELMARMEEVGTQRLDQRLARLLLERGPDVEATHQALADDLGTVREVVSRILNGFESRGMVALGRGRVRVLRPADLAHRARNGAGRAVLAG